MIIPVKCFTCGNVLADKYRYYLKERKLSYVNEGTRSILHATNVQSFLIEKFRFRKAYCKLHIQYHPLVNIIIIML